MSRLVRPRHRIHLPATLGTATSLLYACGLMTFFWAFFDGIVSYISPLLIVGQGFSKTALGLLLASSSAFGALFDYTLARYLRNPHYRGVYFFMFVACTLLLAVLEEAHTLTLFLVGMALWGLYYNLHNFGGFDFVSRTAAEADRGHHLGVLNAFKFLGYIVAPLMVGLLLADAGATVGGRPFVLAGAAIGISFLFYLIVASERHAAAELPSTDRPARTIGGFGTLRRLGSIIFPVLCFTALYNIVESFFWTLGPLLAESFKELHPLNGLFVTAYFLPLLFSGWLVGRLTRALGKKRSAFVAMAAGALILTSFLLVRDPYLSLALIFVASLFITFSLPASNAAYVDYITEDRGEEREIEALTDFAANTGYVVGPVLAGVLADRVGNLETLGLLGVMAFVASLTLLKLTPRSIKVS